MPDTNISKKKKKKRSRFEYEVWLIQGVLFFSQQESLPLNRTFQNTPVWLNSRLCINQHDISHAKKQRKRSSYIKSSIHWTILLPGKRFQNLSSATRNSEKLHHMVFFFISTMRLFHNSYYSYRMLKGIIEKF